MKARPTRRPEAGSAERLPVHLPGNGPTDQDEVRRRSPQ